MGHPLNLLSRALIAAIFLYSGFLKIVAFGPTVSYAASAGLPAPAAGIAAAIAIELGAGLAFLLGWRIRWTSLALFLYMIPTTLIFHAAHLGDAAQFRAQIVEVMKNLAIMGGLLKFYVDASPATSPA